VTARLGARLSAFLADAGLADAGLADAGLAGPGEPEAAARRRGDAGKPPGEQALTVMLQVSDADLGALEAAGLHFVTGMEPVLTGVVLPSNVLAVADVPGVVSIDLPAMQRPDLHESVPATHADQVRTGPLGLDGTGVIIGVVDSGIDIYHHSFRKADGTTRLLSLLDTTTPSNIQAGGGPNGGTFTISWQPPDRGGVTPPVQTTGPLPFNAQSNQVLTALVALAAIDPGDVSVSGGPLPGAPITVFFQGQYLHKDVEPLTVTSSVTPGTATIAVVRGREYTPAEINAALASPAAPFFSWDSLGHGSHVMGIAGGNGSQAGNCHLSDYYIGVAPGADLIAVKTTFSDADTIRGVNHVFSRAAAVNQAAVVNLSLGGEIGAHDGSANDEQIYDLLLTTTPAGRAIVVSAGNDGDLFDVTKPDRQKDRGGGLHSIVSIGPTATTTLRFIIQPGDRRDDWFDIWYSGASRLSFQLTEPGGATLTGPVAPGAPAYTTPLAGNRLRITNTVAASTTGRHNISMRLRPPAAAGSVVTAGPWIITLTEAAGTGTDVDCWIVLDKKDPHPRFSNEVQDRTRTLTIPATAHNVITVANYDYRDNTLAESSSRGPTTDTRPPGETKPDIAAPGTGITSVLSGVSPNPACCKCCYDYYVAMNGTSMAAPHITGIVALMFERNRTLTFSDVRAALRAHADPPDPITGPTLPNADWGAGIVNAETTVNAVPAHVAVTDSPVAVPTFPVPGTVPAVVPGLVATLSTGAGAARVRDLRCAVLAAPAGQVLAALVSTHADEVVRLVNHERRVIVAWHRMRGPDVLQELLRDIDGPLIVPETIAPGLARLLDELARAGSPRLRADIARHRDLLLALPGLSIADLDRLPLAG
jgi:subtilisin family serine protease